MKTSALLLQETCHGCPTNTKKSKSWNEPITLLITAATARQIKVKFIPSVCQFSAEPGLQAQILLLVHQKSHISHQLRNTQQC